MGQRIHNVRSAALWVTESDKTLAEDQQLVPQEVLAMKEKMNLKNKNPLYIMCVGLLSQLK